MIAKEDSPAPAVTMAWLPWWKNDYAYDALDRVTSETATQTGLDTVTFTSSYDLASRRTALTAAFGSSSATPDFANSYGYDGLGRLTDIVQQGQTGGNAVASKHVTFLYNGRGQITNISRYESTGTSNHVVDSTLDYDYLGRLTDISHGSLAGYSYVYDAASRITVSVPRTASCVRSANRIFDFPG